MGVRVSLPRGGGKAGLEGRETMVGVHSRLAAARLSGFFSVPSVPA